MQGTASDGDAAAYRRPAGTPQMALLLAATLLTLVIAAPVVVAPTERIFGNEVVGRHHDPFTVMRQFAGAEVPAPYLQPVTDLSGRALALLLPPIAAYNVVLLVSFPLAALFGYWLGFAMTRSRFAASVAGLAFAFSPFHLAHAAYHPHVAQVQWMALYLLALWLCLHGFTVARGFLLVAAAGLVAMSNWYGGFIALVLTPVVVPLFWLIPSPAEPARERRDLAATAGVLATLAVVSIVALQLLAPDVLYRPDVLRADYEDLFRYSARWWAHFVPPVDHAVLGPWAQGLWSRFGIGNALLEQQLYLGFGVTLLAALAGAQWLRGKSAAGVRAVPALAAIAALALLCALSPSREIAGWQTLRPSAVLYEFAPMFRSYARFSVVVSLMATLLAGIGAASLWRSGHRAARGVVVVLLALAAFEYAPLPWRSRDVLPTSAHRWLAAAEGTPRAFDCAEMTLADLDTAWLAGYTITHAHAQEPDCGAPSLGRQLASAGATHLIVRFDSPAWPLLREAKRPGLQSSYRGTDAAVFRVVAEPQAVFVDGMRGWYPREYDGIHTWRWTGGEASLIVANPGHATRAAALELELGSFAAPRRVSVTVNDEPLADLTVEPNALTHRVDGIELRPGNNLVELTTYDDPMTPRSLDPNASDDRALAFYLGQWRLTVLPTGR